jgi:Tfp pilus assembly pilus retraction ATPase PilT
VLREDGTLNPLDDCPDLDAQTLEAVLAQVTASVPRKLADFHETGELDVAYTGRNDLPRFRVSGFRQRRGAPQVKPIATANGWR